MAKKGIEIAREGLDVKDLIADLNKAYCDEWLAYHSYHYMAQTVTGPAYEDMSEFLEKVAKVELEHTAELANRICVLGGMPIVSPSEFEGNAHYPYPRPSMSTDDYNAIIDLVVRSEGRAIEVYNNISKKTFGKDHVTYQLVMHILGEEEQHEEMFENLRKTAAPAFTK